MEEKGRAPLESIEQIHSRPSVSCQYDSRQYDSRQCLVSTIVVSTIVVSTIVVSVLSVALNCSVLTVS